MDNVTAVNVTRQQALHDEMDAIATNLANLSTHGYRREGLVFAEFVKKTDHPELGSLSMADARGRFIDLGQGELVRTGGQFDLAIEGEGFFQIETAQGPRLTRAGAFRPNQDGELVDFDGNRLLDAGGGPINVPVEARQILIAPDGAMSADGQLIAQVGVFDVNETALRREAGTLFSAGDEAIEPAQNFSIAQGHLEDANVNPILEMARMIEVQRAYELGSQLMGAQSDLAQNAIDTLGRTV